MTVTLTRAQILALEQILGLDAPQKVKAMEGKKGRRPKWRYSDVEPEERAAIAVELERIKRDVKARRTPAAIFAFVADELAMSVRSVRRFHGRHCELGRGFAAYLVKVQAKRRGKA